MWEVRLWGWCLGVRCGDEGERWVVFAFFEIGSFRRGLGLADGLKVVGLVIVLSSLLLRWGVGPECREDGC